MTVNPGCYRHTRKYLDPAASSIAIGSKSKKLKAVSLLASLP